jgi:hypothetical protein
MPTATMESGFSMRTQGRRFFFTTVHEICTVARVSSAMPVNSVSPWPPWTSPT